MNVHQTNTALGTSLPAGAALIETFQLLGPTKLPIIADWVGQMQIQNVQQLVPGAQMQSVLSIRTALVTSIADIANNKVTYHEKWTQIQ